MGSLVQAGGGLLSGIVDFPGTFNSAIRDVGEAVSVGEQHGVALGVGQYIGTNQVVAGYVGNDINGMPVDRAAAFADGLNRLSGTVLAGTGATGPVRRGVAPNTSGGTGFSGRKGFELKNSPAQPVRNAPTNINGRDFSGHALDQMQNRGIPPSVVDNAIKHGKPFAGNRPGTQGFFDPVNKVRVITNSETGRVITVIPGGG